MSAAAAEPEQPPPPESVRLPVRHNLSLRPSRRRCGRGQSLHLAVDLWRLRRWERIHVRRARVLCSWRRPARRTESNSARRRTLTQPVSATCTAIRSGGCSDGTAALLLVAAVLMVVAPFWITRRRRLRPLTAADAPAVRRGGRELAGSRASSHRASSGTPSTPPAEVSRSATPAATALRSAAGSSSSRQWIHPHSARSFATSFAHIRNRDVGITYFTLAVWYAFLLVAVVPFMLTLLDEGSVAIFSVTWRLLVLAALVYLIRNAVLRSREVYADLRASVPDGPQGALRRVLAGLRT